MIPNLEETEEPVNVQRVTHRGRPGSRTFPPRRNRNVCRQKRPLPLTLWELFCASAAGLSVFLLLLLLPLSTLSRELTQLRAGAEQQGQFGSFHLTKKNRL